MLYDTSRTGSRAVPFETIRNAFENARRHSTVLRRKLVGGTRGLDTPYWVDDPEFDLEFHVRHIALPGRGDWQELCALLGRHS